MMESLQEDIMITVRRLTQDLLEDYLDFFDHRAFSDGSPFYPCYCTAFNMSRERILQHSSAGRYVPENAAVFDGP